MSGTPLREVVVLDDGAALATAVAERFAEHAVEAIAARGRFDVALAGGSTPKAAYHVLASDFRDRVTWPAVRFFFSDERTVGPDHADSNYKMALDAMLAPLAIDDDAIFRMRGEDEPAAAARAYAELVREALDTPPSQTPVFDLVMLGMGPDGHTASLFPGGDPFADDAQLVRAPYVAKFSTYRITFTPSLINAARRVQIATGGDEKAEAVARALEGPYEPSETPIQIAAPDPGALAWLIDRAAAAHLTERNPKAPR